MNLIEFIPVGRTNALPMRDLAAQLNVTSREVRALVQRERENGAPICSDFENGGYYMPNDTAEAQRYYRTQSARIKTARAALNGVKKYLKGGGDDD